MKVCQKTKRRVNEEIMIKEAKKKKYKTLPSNIHFNPVSQKIEKVDAEFDKLIQKEFETSNYIYGLNLLHGLGCTTNFCECEACLVSYYCITCSEYECNDCSDYHKNHLLSRYKFKYQLPICEAHNEIISLVCMRCSIGICDKCINHSKHNYKDIRDYYEIINTKMLNKY